MVSGRRLEDVWKPWPLLTKAQIEESPSFKLGMSFKTERRLRDSACKVIAEAGKRELISVHIWPSLVHQDTMFYC